MQKALDKLRTLGDFRRALVLDDWRDLYRDDLGARSDLALRQWVARRFSQTVREVLLRGDDAQRVAVAGMLAQMGTETSPGEIVASTLRGLAPDLVRLIRSSSSTVQQAAACLTLSGSEPMNCR